MRIQALLLAFWFGISAFSTTWAQEKIAPSASPEQAEKKIAPSTTSEKETLPPPAPDFLRNRQEIPEFLLRDKREGVYWTGVPMIGWDPDTGFNIGAGVERYDNGSKDDPLFRKSPYKRRIAAGAVWAHRGFYRIFAAYDEPYIAGSPYRPWGFVSFSENKEQNYFGVGNEAMENLSFPGSNQEYTNMDDFRNALSVSADGTTAYTKYDRYQQQLVEVRPALERVWLGGSLRTQAGLGFAYYDVKDLTGSTVSGRLPDGSTGNVTQLQTKLAEDCSSGKVIGCEGGWDNQLKLGLAYDTRDFESDPMKGVFAQTTGGFATKALGSAKSYIRWTTQLAAYQSVFPKAWQKWNQSMVLAGHFLYNAQFLDVPFYAMDTLAHVGVDKRGLGGYNSMRGYKANRFVGPASMLWNVEARYTFARARLWSQDLKFGAKPFLDVGRVFDGIEDTTFKDMRFAGGAGFLLAWNLATIVNFDFAFSEEGHALYMELGHTF